MTVLNAILGTLTFLVITVVFTFVTWLLFRLAIKEKADEEVITKKIT